MTKTKSRLTTVLILICLLVFTSLSLFGCGDNVITNVTSLSGIVDIVQISTVDDNLNSITITYLTEVTGVTATYGENQLEVEPVVIEDYYNDSSNITAYSYTYTIDSISIEEYNLSPITINMSVGNNQYRFNLTTNLISLIYPELVDETTT